MNTFLIIADGICRLPTCVKPYGVAYDTSYETKGRLSI